MVMVDKTHWVLAGALPGAQVLEQMRGMRVAKPPRLRRLRKLRTGASVMQPATEHSRAYLWTLRESD